MKQLVFNDYGGVQLLASDANPAKILWSSDDDEEFLERAEQDVFDSEDDDDIDTLCDYLVEVGHMNEGEDFDIVPASMSELADDEEDEEDEDDDD